MPLFDTVTVKYDCKISRTARVNQVFDAFGLDISQYDHVVVDDIQMPTKWDLIYITGISGSGKSSLLKYLSTQHDFDLSRYGMQSMYSRMRNDERPLIDCIGTSFDDALSTLNSVGLSEAFVYFKNFKQLSEGQKYRFYLGKLLKLNKSVILVDEFVSLLDRITANIVAYNYQKALRRLRKRLVVATSHDDLLKSLNPSHVITFSYSGEHLLERVPKIDSEPPFLSEIDMVNAGKASDTSLLKYHYKNTKMPAMITNVFNAVFRGIPIGMIVYSVPMRTYMLGSFPMRDEERSRYDKLTVDEKRLLSGNNTVIISRVVIHPAFRGIGLGAHLLRETLPLVNKRVVVLSSVMSNYVSFCEAAGMTQIEKSSTKFRRLTSFYRKYGIDSTQVNNSVEYRHETIDRIRGDKACLKEYIELVALYTKRVMRKDAPRRLFEKYLIKIRPINAKTFYWVNEDVSINFGSIVKFRGKLIRKVRKEVDHARRTKNQTHNRQRREE